ncbi:MAG: IPTL-CTERM sorting domain-containing protein [Gammaproteobacteria bacterium]|nr:IPTL-CTERM sorting domain-containing protein [Gammaproteobacteria bacterium]NBT45554.1 IPTL-CTERM sorting domain-containing protein [Gammaproteobacteria bacterium]NBY22840.1 IPTL-CTERM sorting domain-containing protein [Gammaproteobacteria bacterium]
MIFCISLGPSSPATTPTPSPAPIPTLSEWAKITMMLIMILAVGFYGWRTKQR